MTIEQRPYLTDAEMLEICAPLIRSDAIRRWFMREGFHVAKKPNTITSLSNFKETCDLCLPTASICATM